LCEQTFGRTNVRLRRRNAPGRIAWELELGNSAGRAENLEKKKKKDPPLILYHNTPGLVKRFLKNFFVKFL
jgi:hypothetical protein